MTRRREPLALWTCVIGAWLSLGFALYLTLLPFEFGGMGLEEAWSLYRDMSLQGPGASGRAQFMANAMMFMPLGFFWMAWLTYGRSHLVWHLGALALVALLGLAATATVEFLQIWLPYRYPAGADIAGNFLGAVVGALMWWGLRRPLLRWRGQLAGPNRVTVPAVLIAYAILYVAIGLAPFDLVLSTAEWSQRLDSDTWGLWVAAGACTSGLRCISELGLTLVASVPVGILLAYGLGRRPSANGAVLMTLAALLAILLEALNLATLSGIAEGRSAVLRGAGFVTGMLLYAYLSPPQLMQTLRRAAIPLLVVATPLYGVALLALNHDLGPYQWDRAAISAQWAQLNLWPFYYHYFVGETVALRSAALHVAMYLPLGALIWLAQIRRPLHPRQLQWLAALGGLLAALLMEGGKLLVVGLRPDPASLVLATLAAWGMATALHFLTRLATEASTTSHTRARPPGSAPVTAERSTVISEPSRREHERDELQF
ncbi:VanZ family protein [Thioalkalivibrio sp. ALJ15]|uniref:VanZ family protein n=1 Tax=Thioalkalivibrio sp. ALJ15 TaxID=748652 RepID=UPI0003676B6F|nr:VanZ family protein [Thioalkalivibrio sp. ALJ15]